MIYTDLDSRTLQWSQAREQRRATLQTRELDIARQETEVSDLLQDLTARLSLATTRREEIRQQRVALDADKEQAQANDDELIAELSKGHRGAPSPKRQRGDGER